MAGHKKAPGPVGARVGGNLRRIRQTAGVSMAALSRKLADFGSPMAPEGVLHTETGKRRMDVDDLVAFAVALDVTPAVLLMPETPTMTPLSESVPLTPKFTTSAGLAWPWMRGEMPLSGDGPRSEAAFAVAGHPDRFFFSVPSEGPGMDAYQQMIKAVAACFRAGYTSSQIRTAFEMGFIGALNSRERR